MTLKQISQMVLVAALAGAGMAATAAETWTYGSTSGGNAVDTTTSTTALTTTGVYAANNSAGSCTTDPCTNNLSSGIKGNWIGNPMPAGYYNANGAYSATSKSGYTYNAAPTFANLIMYSGGGLGMGSDGTSEPTHAIDNSRANTEGVLLSFSQKTMLTGVDIGYKNTDADISVWAYLGNGTPTLTATGADFASMTTAGWTLVGNYGDLTTDASSPYNYNLINGATNTVTSSSCTSSGYAWKASVSKCYTTTSYTTQVTVIPAAASNSIASSWWLITAYNSSYGAATTGTVNQGNDYFKLLSVAGTTCTTSSTQTTCRPPGNKVPEPASLALVGVGLLGAVGVRRRRSAAAA